MKKYSLILAALIWLTLLNTGISFASMDPQVEVYLNNNPRCSTELETISKQEKWHETNVPAVFVAGKNFNNGKNIIEIIIDGKSIAKRKVNIANNVFTEKFELSKTLVDTKKTKMIEVKIGANFYKKFFIKLNKLYGTARYFDGKPIKHPIVIAHPGNYGMPESMVTVGDENGNFEISLSSKMYCIGIFDKNYTKETLECWLTDVNLKDDIRLDPKIDKAEVYEFRAWGAHTGTYIHFIPMCLMAGEEATSEADKIGLKGKERELFISKDPRTWPPLKKENVKVFISEKEVPISTFSEYGDYIAEDNGKVATRRGYILGIAGKDWKDGSNIIKVQIEYHLKIGEKEIVGKGEGYFFGYH